MAYNQSKNPFSISSPGSSPLRVETNSGNTDPDTDFTNTTDVTEGNVRTMQRERTDTTFEPTGNISDLNESQKQWRLDQIEKAGSEEAYRKQFDIGRKDNVVVEERVIEDFETPTENVEIIKEQQAVPFFNFPGRGEVNFDERGWQQTEAGQQAVQYFGQMGKNLGDQMSDMSTYSKRKLLNELNMYGDENMTKVMVDMHNKNPKKLEAIIRKYQPSNIGEGGMEEIETEVVTQGIDNSQTDTGWRARLND